MPMKLTKSRIDAVVPQPKRFVVWDSAIPGFGLSVHPKGLKTFVLKYRTVDGTQRKPTIGTYGAITLEQARDIANDILAKVRAGEDPSRARKEARLAPTVADLVDRYWNEHALIYKKPSSIKADRVNIDKHVLPAFGTRKVASITFDDVSRLHKSMFETPGAANRTVALLSKMFNLAEKWQIRPPYSNPCRHVTKYKERRIHRDLNELELARLAKVLLESEPYESPHAIAAIRLLLFSGMRVGEVLSLRWAEVDLDRGALFLKDSKTGAKTVHLNSAARELLSSRERVLGNEYVFPGKLPGKPIMDLNKPWRRIRRRAALPELRLHDLRHNFASAAAASGLSLTVIGKLLGHRSPLTTSRYADLADDPTRAASEMVGRRIAEAMMIAVQ